MESGHLTFSYKPFPLPGDKLRPVAEVVLRYHGNIFRANCIIDSGADICTFPIEFAHILRIPKEELQKKPVLTGCACGNTIPHYHVPIEVEIENHIMPVMAAFVPGGREGKAMCALLGREGIFDKFNIVFHADEKVTFSLRT